MHVKIVILFISEQKYFRYRNGFYLSRVTLAKIQIWTKIKIFRTWNGEEVKNKSFFEFFKRHQRPIMENKIVSYKIYQIIRCLSWYLVCPTKLRGLIWCTNWCCHLASHVYFWHFCEMWDSCNCLFSYLSLLLFYWLTFCSMQVKWVFLLL